MESPTLDTRDDTDKFDVDINESYVIDNENNRKWVKVHHSSDLNSNSDYPVGDQ